MDSHQSLNSPLGFAVEPDKAPPCATPWTILVVDDDEAVHLVTNLALDDFTLHGRPLRILHAYNGHDSVEIMRRESDVALVLMDVVMETERAGLDAVQAIRTDLANRFVRIVLRTGQPGHAPERDVVRRFDINDYKEKTELTDIKLFTLITTGLNHYRELIAIDQSRSGLKKVIDASATISELRSLTQFAHGVLEQLTALLYAPLNPAAIKSAGVVVTRRNVDYRILAGYGDYARHEGSHATNVLGIQAMQRIEHAFHSADPVVADFYFALNVITNSEIQHVVYISSESPISPTDIGLIHLFCRNVTIAFDNLDLHQEIIDSQRQLIVLLSSAVEERSDDLRNHVRRVAEYSRLIGQHLGLNDADLDSLAMAAAMHDLGKITIPDTILNKPGSHTADERAVMESHVIRGEQMLLGQSGRLLKMAGVVVSEHHEHWDGSGYPRHLRGEQIHLFGRIVAVADVFDALTTARCYKASWSVERAITFIDEQSGSRFDPQVVDVFLKHLDEILAIKSRLHNKNGTYNEAAKSNAACN